MYLKTLCSPVKCITALQTLLCPDENKATSANITLDHLEPLDGDLKTIERCNELLSYGDGLLSEGAQSTLIIRGLYWQAREDRETKALFFFVEAQSNGRIINLLNHTFENCIVDYCKYVAFTENVLLMQYNLPTDIHLTTSRLYVS
jgi:hypothetical protein